jgi:predicted nucleic acid-binding protein
VKLPVVVADTSPIRALAYLKHLALLERLFGTVFVPPAVERELHHPRDGGSPVDISPFPFLRVALPLDVGRVEELQADLDPGEAEAIALALQLNAGLLLVDERKARLFAQRAGIPFVGVLGILLRAKQQNLVLAVKPLAFQLRDGLRFFVGDELMKEILARAGE